MAGNTVWTFTGRLQCLAMSAFEIIFQYADVTFAAKLGYFRMPRQTNKPPFMGHCHSSVPAVSAVTVMTGNIILIVPAHFPFLGDSLELIAHHI
jgi:hypothetical protein